MKNNSIVSSRNFQIVLFFILGLLFFICISSFDPYITPYAEEKGMPVTQIGVILAIAGFSSIIVRFPIGIFAELFKRKKILIQIGLILTVVSWFLAFMFPSVKTLCIGKFADGATGGTWVLYTVLFSLYFKDEEIPKAISIIQLASTVGPFIGMNIGGMVSSMYGYDYSFIVAVIAAAIGIILSLFIVEPEEKSSKVSAKEAWVLGKDQLKDKDVWILGLFAGIAMMTTYAGTDLLDPLVTTKLGGGAISITILSNLFFAFNSVASLLSGTYFSKKLGLVKTVVIGLVGQAIVAFIKPFSTSLIMLYVLRSFAGFFFGMTVTLLMALVIMGVSKEVQSARMGLYQSIYSIGLMVGPPIAGYVLDGTNMMIAYFVTGAAVIILAGISKKLLPAHLLEHHES